MVAARLQLVDSRKDIDQKNVFICLHALAYIHTNIQTDRKTDRPWRNTLVLFHQYG